MKTALAFLFVLSCVADAAQEKEPTTLRGTLQFQPLEGGFWTLKYKGKTYDLHGLKDKKGFAAGDEVVVTGKVLTDQCCIHAAGPIFQVATIKKATPK